jgi:ribosomal protein S18 acetylase RimI-like enzyme
MVRGTVTTRRAEPADLPVILELWNELRASSGRASQAASRELPPNVEGRLRGLLGDRGSAVLLALDDDRPVGMAVLTTMSLGPLTDARVAHLTHLVVSRSHRHHGVGKALVAAAAEQAEDLGVDDLVASVYPSLREANRFFARLGFAPLSVRRVAAVAPLLRRLGRTEPRLSMRRLARRPTVRRVRRSPVGPLA